MDRQQSMNLRRNWTSMKKFVSHKFSENVIKVKSAGDFKNQNALKVVGFNEKKQSCYNCGKAGHYASNCSAPKLEPNSCFKCGSKEDQKENCPKQNTVK